MRAVAGDEFGIASLRAADYFFRMSFESLTREVAGWPDDQIRRFQAFLVTLRHQREESAVEKLNDRDPSNWISLEDVEEQKGRTNK